MNDLNVMLRQQAQAGLQASLDRAVEAGDTETARKVSDQIAQLAVQTTPKAPAFNDQDIKEALNKKADWFGIDPRKSAKAVEFGKMMDPKKFPSAEAFADALLKTVDEEFKPATQARKEAGDENEEDETGDGNEDGEEAGATDSNKQEPRQRRTDGPGERDAGVRVNPRRNSNGPWTKLADAPREVQTEIKRQADKLAPRDKDAREKFIARALEAHSNIHQKKQARK